MKSASPQRKTFYPIRWPRDTFWQHESFNFAKLRLFVTNSVCHKMMVFENFGPIMKYNDIFRQSYWTKNLEAMRDGQLIFYKESRRNIFFYRTSGSKIKTENFLWQIDKFVPWHGTERYFSSVLLSNKLLRSLVLASFFPRIHVLLPKLHISQRNGSGIIFIFHWRTLNSECSRVYLGHTKVFFCTFESL